MVGNMIYLLFRQDLQNGGFTLETPHATWDGAMKHIDELRAHWYSKGMLLQDSDSGLIVCAAFNCGCWTLKKGERVLFEAH